MMTRFKTFCFCVFISLLCYNCSNSNDTVIDYELLAQEIVNDSPYNCDYGTDDEDVSNVKSCNYKMIFDSSFKGEMERNVVIRKNELIGKGAVNSLFKWKILSGNGLSAIVQITFTGGELLKVNFIKNKKWEVVFDYEEDPIPFERNCIFEPIINFSSKLWNVGNFYTGGDWNKYDNDKARAKYTKEEDIRALNALTITFQEDGTLQGRLANNATLTGRWQANGDKRTISIANLKTSNTVIGKSKELVEALQNAVYYKEDKNYLKLAPAAKNSYVQFGFYSN